MATLQPSESITHAEAIYNARFRNQLESTNRGDFVAVEPVSEEFFLGKTLSEAIQAARGACRSLAGRVSGWTQGRHRTGVISA